MRYEENYYSAVVQRELSSAFDIISSSKCINKLNYFGIMSRDLSLYQPFLTNRKQFVSIDTFKSKIIHCPPCSVIQGSKLLTTLYTLFVNEITTIYKIINTSLGNK